MVVGRPAAHPVEKPKKIGMRCYLNFAPRSQWAISRSFATAVFYACDRRIVGVGGVDRPLSGSGLHEHPPQSARTVYLRLRFPRLWTFVRWNEIESQVRFDGQICRTLARLAERGSMSGGSVFACICTA